jgi:hypothetical protein
MEVVSVRASRRGRPFVRLRCAGERWRNVVSGALNGPVPCGKPEVWGGPETATGRRTLNTLRVVERAAFRTGSGANGAVQHYIG